jgi:hypothetical protein
MMQNNLLLDDSLSEHKGNFVLNILKTNTSQFYLSKIQAVIAT